MKIFNNIFSRRIIVCFAIVSLSLAALAIAQSLRLATPDEIQRYAGTADMNQREGLLNAVGLTADSSRVTPTSNSNGGTLTNISSVVARISNIINLFIPFLIALAVFLIIYGIFGYISQAADEEKRKEAKDFIMWGIIGVFVMISIWGLINILLKSFKTDTSNAIVKTVYPTGAVPVLPADPTIIDLIARVVAVGNYIIGFLISLAVFIIILGILNYIRQGDNEEKRAEARMFIIWGVISVFLMLSIWGLVNILVKSFPLDNSVTVNTIPALPRL